VCLCSSSCEDVGTDDDSEDESTGVHRPDDDDDGGDDDNDDNLPVDTNDVSAEPNDICEATS